MILFSKLKQFEYIAPSSLEEACQITKKHGDAKLLAGGQSLLPIMKLNLAEVSHVVDLKRIPNLSFINLEPSGNGKNPLLVVGALTRHEEIAHSEIVDRHVPLLAKTAGAIGHPLVRNRGTIGGSLAHCDPAADLCVTSLALDASMIVARYDGTRRTVEAREFFKGTFSTALEAGEILEKVSFPVPKNGSGYGFEKLTMGHGDFPLVVVSALLMMKGQRCEEAAIALGGVADKAIRIPEAESALKEKGIVDEKAIDLAASIATERSDPKPDLDVSASYKKKMVGVFVKRALKKAVETSSGGSRETS
jgi:carbon-monoxide dehydrogenase medium subunit